MSVFTKTFHLALLDSTSSRDDGESVTESNSFVIILS